jgi:GH18 family chitinase
MAYLSQTWERLVSRYGFSHIATKYVVQKYLGGFLFWDLGQDDAKSTLLNAVRKYLRAN